MTDNPINWNDPDSLCIVHIDGTGPLYPVERGDFWPDRSGDYRLGKEAPDNCIWFKSDGFSLTESCKYRIRNRADVEAERAAEQTANEWWMDEGLRAEVIECLRCVSRMTETSQAEKARDLLARIESCDPLHDDAIEILLNDGVSRTDNQNQAIRDGRAGGDKIALIIAGIRRGMQIEKARTTQENDQ